MNSSPDDIPCQVCTGKGYITAEAADGMPLQLTTCPYCGGDGANTWVEVRAVARRQNEARRATHLLVGLIIATLVVYSCHSVVWFSADTPGPGFGIYLLLWLGLIAGWIRYWIIRPPKQGKAKHAPGFTTDHERMAVGAFAAVVAARAAWDEHIKKSHNDARPGM